MTSARLPIRVQPLPDEPIDSWIEAYAARLRATVGEIWPIFFPTLTRQQRILPFYRRLGEREVGHLSFITGVAPNTIASSVPFDGSLDAELLGHSRWCPTCLEERNGRWRTIWRHPLSVVCVDHATRLLDSCDACAQAPRQRFTHRNIPQLGHCGERDPRSLRNLGPNVPRCAEDLRGHRSASVGEEALEAQRIIDPLISRAYREDPIAIELLDDAVVVMKLTVGNLAAPGHLDKLMAGLPKSAAVAERPLNLERLKSVSDHDQKSRPAAIPSGLSGLSEPVRAALLKVRDPHMRRTDRIRHASATANPVADLSACADSTAALLARVPSLLWPETTLQLRAIVGGPTSSIRRFVPIALALTGSLRSCGALVEDSHFRMEGKGLSYAVSAWLNGKDASVVFRAIADLSRLLQQNPSPIDYSQRERIAGAGHLLSRPDWIKISDASGMPAGGTKRLLFANAYVYELFTGGDHAKWQPAVDAFDPAAETEYRAFTVRMGDETARLLRHHAEQLLRSARIDEPLSWHPPLDLGGDPQEFFEKAWRYIDDKESPGRISDRLGVDLEHLRLAMLINPRQQPQAPPPPPNERIPLTGALSKESLSSLLREGLTFREIAKRVGHDRKTVAAAVRTHGLPVPTAGRRATEIDGQWFTEQYWTLERTLPDIAVELGMTPTNLARRVKELGIPLRRRGGGSHALPSSATKIPLPLRDALRGQGSIQRLERFREIAEDCNFSATAKRLHVHQSALSVQLKKLENATGLRLVQRDRQGPGVVHQVTVQGRTLLKQFEDWQNSQTADARSNS